MESNIVMTILMDVRFVIAVVGILLGFFFNRQLVKIRKELDIKERLIQRKVVVYPNFAEPVYRIRNTLRDFIHDFRPANEFIDKFNLQKDKLVEALYEYRLDLDKSEFEIIHAYKNKSLYAIQLIEDLQYYQKRNDQANIDDTKEKIKALYDEIEKGYITIADKLSFSNLKKSD